MKLRCLLTSLTIIGLIACSDGPEVNQNKLVNRSGKFYLKTSAEPFTGVGIIYYGFGEKKAENRYKNGFSHGSQTTYYPDGTKETEVEWSEGKRLSFRSWYLTGDRREYTKLSGDNTWTGLYQAWWASGEKRAIYSLKNGQIVPGSATYWDMDGNELK